MVLIVNIVAMGSSVSRRRFKMNQVSALGPTCSAWMQRFYSQAMSILNRDDLIILLFTDSALRECFLEYLKNKSSGVIDIILPTDYRNFSTRLLSGLEELLTAAKELSNQDIIEMVFTPKNIPTVSLLPYFAPRFVQSEYFSNWRTLKSAELVMFLDDVNNAIITLPEILCPSIRDNRNSIVTAEAFFLQNKVKGQVNLSLAEDANSQFDSTHRLRGDKTVPAVECFPYASMSLSSEIFENLYAAIDYLEVHRLISCSSWLFSFLEMVETLPISVTLTSASRDRAGFPIIYANRYFERVTRFDRKGVIGANCRFLQRNSRRGGMDLVDGFNDGELEYLRLCLREGKPCRSILRNYRFDGTPFTNLVYTKPLFNARKKCMYVLGVQLDISSAFNRIACVDNSYKVQMIAEIMSTIPELL